SSPFSTLMESAPYSFGAAAGSAGVIKWAPHQRDTPGRSDLADWGYLPNGDGDFWPDFKGIEGAGAGFWSVVPKPGNCACAQAAHRTGPAAAGAARLPHCPLLHRRERHKVVRAGQ